MEKECRLTIIRPDVYVSKTGKKYKGYLCECKCGNKKIVKKNEFENKKVRSCGCLISDFNKTKIGNSYSSMRRKVVSHKKLNPDYVRIKRIWKNMRNRCGNPNATSYEIYGGRGITVCEEWRQDFFAFYNWAISNGYRNDLSIDRIDVNGNYEPLNCRWATMKVQDNNRRNTVFIEHNGETKPISEWAEITEINRSTLNNRYYKGLRGKKLFEKAHDPKGKTWVMENGRRMWKECV